MKKLITLAFCLYVMPGLFAQNVQRYDHNSPWFFGLNVGAAWNSTDIENETNAGWGFTFGRSFATRADAIFAWDLRMRYLQGNWYGQDYDTTNLNGYTGYTPTEYQAYADNPGYTVNNFSARNHHLGLELVLHANRLRQRTGWDPYIFGGANITWNQTYSDLVNIDSSFGFSGQYDYDPNFISNTLPGGAILDGVYETAMNQGSEGGDYNLDFMPSLGVGIAYYPGPRFALGLEHKSTFTRKDDWDGYVDPTPGLWGRSNDIYHYTNFFLRFHLRGSDAVNNTTNNNIAPCPDPIIQIQRPSTASATVESQVFAFRAQIENINSIQNVRVRVNGQESGNFFYSTTTRMLEGSVVLNQGANQIQVVASNSCGSDMETVTINYNPCRAPIVRFTDPSQNNINVDNPVYRVRASIANGGSISYTVNGVTSSNFFYQQGNGSFESTVNLREGSNTITITTTNDCGSDTETITIMYTDCEDPRINFASGNGSVINVTSPSALIRATIFGIDDRNAIGFRVNGANRAFNYNSGSNQLEANIALTPGANRIQITVGNDCGTDTETMTVNYTPCSNPIVNILTPVRTGTTNSTGTQLIEASVTNATNVNQIQMLVNGVQVAGGNFNPVTRIYTNTAALNAGTNIIQIVVNNECGSDSETTNVLYEVNCPVPMISLASTISTQHQSAMPIQYVVQNVNSASQITLMLNGVPVQGGFFNNQTNVFSATLALIEGANTITINATNNCGADSETIVVYYTQPCDDPIIAMINPIGNQLSVTDAQFDVQSILQNVSSANQVQLSVNGSMDVSGSYNHITQVYHNTINLQQGLNTIVMTVNNGCSTVSEMFVIDYSPCLQPVVSIVSPNGGSTENANTVVTATVLNVDAANIEVIVNGVVYSGNYNAMTGAFTANVPLNAGANSIQVVATNECGTISQTTSITYAPCTPPSVQFVTTPRGLRNTQSVNIEAQVTGVNNASEITATHNGNTVTGSYNASTNMYSFTVTLANGVNTITVTASNDCGSDSQSTTINYVEPCDAPQVSITSPANGTNAANTTVQLSASVQNAANANQVQLIVNGNVQSGNLNVTTGAFTATINLQQGANTIQVIVTNECGSASENITVLYRPCLAPTVQLVAPQGGTTQSGTTSLQAVVNNVNSANDISLTVNGSPVSGSYNAMSNMFTANITLTSGTNNIVVSASNSCGNDSKSVSVTYNEPCLEPQVSIATPSNNAQVATNTVQLAATIVNISTAGEVQLLVNGATHQGSYNSATHTYTATVPVQSGNNIIEVIASNDCGTATETVNVTYSPCVTPGIQIVSPLQTTTTNANVNLQAVISGVTSANDVTVTLNGNAVSGTFNTTTNTYSSPLTLTSGSNTIEITATNSCGTDSHVRTITYNEPCNTPQLSFSSPVNGSTVNTNSVQVSAQVTGATGAGNVQLTVNGIQQYVAMDTSGSVSASINLNQGVNAIVLVATNACGTTTETLNVTYTPCVPPSVQIVSPQAGATTNQTVSVVANVTGVESAAALQATLNGSGVTGVYDETAGTYTVQVTLQTGTNTIVVQGTSECGVDGSTLQLIYDQPCDEPTVSITSPAGGTDTSDDHIDVSVTLAHITSASEVTVTVNGNAVSGGSFNSATNVYTTSVPLNTPTNTILVTATNNCGTANSEVVVNKISEATMIICYTPSGSSSPQQMEILVSEWPTYKADGATQGPCPTACGPRFNPGNADWEFCLVTPSGTYSRDDLANNSSFSYSGPASSIFFKPIAGGGDAMVNGSPYPVQNGNYYLFQGVLTVDVSTTHPGSMGHWTVCIEASSVPAYGIGINRPTSPCENSGNGTINNNGGGNGSSQQNGSGSGTQSNTYGGQTGGGLIPGGGGTTGSGTTGGNNNGGNQGGGTSGGSGGSGNGGRDANTSGSGTIKAQQEAKEAAAKKAAEEAAKKKAAEEAAKKAAQEAAAKKAAQQAAAKKAAEEAAKKKAAEEAAKKAAQEAAAKKAAQEAAAKKAAEEAAKKRAAEEAAKKAAQEAAKKAAQEAAAKKAAQEAAAKKAAEEAAKKKAAEEAAKKAAAKKAAEEAAKKKAAEEAAKKKAEEEKKKEEEENKTPTGRTPTSTRGGGGIR
ncbi:MAG: Ig-like domain-containing protein [bacterium]|nr:Ig-like domain-containing protein [bacterium]